MSFNEYCLDVMCLTYPSFVPIYRTRKTNFYLLHEKEDNKVFSILFSLTRRPLYPKQLTVTYLRHLALGGFEPRTFQLALVKHPNQTIPCPEPTIPTVIYIYITGN